jgi:hypothetical protein
VIASVVSTSSTLCDALTDILVTSDDGVEGDSEHCR